MLLQLLKMLIMNMIEEENLIGVVLLIDTGFARYVSVDMYCFEQVSLIIVQIPEQCMKPVQSTANKKIARIYLTS